MKRILVLHGPNLNLLGEREPEIYGRMTLKQINLKIRQYAKNNGIAVKIFQGNGEGELISLLHKHRKWVDGIVINPGAYAHYSYAIRDAISAIGSPAVEIHMSDVEGREKFRRISVIAPVCIKKISGLGWKSYIEGLKIF